MCLSLSEASQFTARLLSDAEALTFFAPFFSFSIVAPELKNDEKYTLKHQMQKTKESF